MYGLRLHCNLCTMEWNVLWCCETVPAFYFSLPSTRIPTNNIITMETHVLVNLGAALPWRTMWPLPPRELVFCSAVQKKRMLRKISVWIPAPFDIVSVRDRQPFICGGSRWSRSRRLEVLCSETWSLTVWWEECVAFQSVDANTQWQESDKLIGKTSLN